MDTILAYSDQDLIKLVSELGLPGFRYKQLKQWLYRHAATCYDDMTNLPLDMRKRLSEAAPLQPPIIVNSQTSADGTKKLLLKLSDDALVETVAIPSRDENAEGQPRRLTVCFSTQVGCSMKCAFCATGTEGFTRNLYPGEIVWQLLLCQKEMGLRVSNAVAMGQGEPFLNYDNLMAALRFINSPDCLGIGARHISISTCGILDGILALSEEPEQFTLAISLHSAIQSVRDELMPRCKKAPLTSLHAVLEQYTQKTGRRVSLEYLMIDHKTDTDEALEALSRFCSGLLVHVNLLRINQVADSPFRPSSPDKIAHFIKHLDQRGVEATLRDSRGADIDGACGQLKNNTCPPTARR